MENSNIEETTSEVTVSTDPTPVVGSILKDISKLLGVQVSEDYFDTDILIHINSALNQLCQLGVGPDTPYKITGINETWSDFMPNISDYEDVKTYIYLYVRLIFDPPSSGFVTDAIKARMAELEWRMYVQADNESDDIFHPGMIYNVGDKVIKDGVHYVRIAPQYAPEKWNFSKWKVYDYQDDTVATYDISKDYVVGNKCKYDNKYYVCIINSTAGEFDASKWVEYKP